MSGTDSPPALAGERASRGARRELDGRVALVTGGTRGIGAAICRTLAADGAAIAAVHQGNVGSAENCRRTVAHVLERHGRLDILVNYEGILIDRAVNLSGAFFMSQAVLPHMVGRGSGRIVNISSLTADLTRSLAREAAVLLGKAGRHDDEQGIGLTVNTVSPGRLGRPEEIARVVHFLCADGSAYVTGQVWSVSGGMEM